MCLMKASLTLLLRCSRLLVDNFLLLLTLAAAFFSSEMPWRRWSALLSCPSSTLEGNACALCLHPQI